MTTTEAWSSGLRPFIALTQRRPYLGISMYRVLASLLVALALFVSPLVMSNGASMAMPHAATQTQVDGHCAGEEAPADTDGTPAKASCASACAACLSLGATSSDQAVVASATLTATGDQVLSGIHPEGETPPPRIPSEI